MFDRKQHQSRATVLHALHSALTLCLSMATFTALLSIFSDAKIYRSIKHLVEIYPLACLDKCWRVTGISHCVAFTTTELNREKCRTPISRFYPSEIIDHTLRKMKTDCRFSTTTQIHCSAKECSTKRRIITVWQTNSRTICSRS